MTTLNRQDYQWILIKQDTAVYSFCSGDSEAVSINHYIQIATGVKRDVKRNNPQNYKSKTSEIFWLYTAFAVT